MLRFKPSRLATLFRRSDAWRISLEPDQLTIRRDGCSEQIPYAEIMSIESASGLIWGKLEIRLSRHKLVLQGLNKTDTLTLLEAARHQVSHAVTEEILLLQEPAKHLRWHLDAFYAAPRFLAQYDLNHWLGALGKLPQPNLSRLQTLAAHPYLESAALPPDLGVSLRKLQDILGGPCQELVYRNVDFVKKELAAHSEFFDSVESRPLTDEQRKAAVIMEDRNLLIAAAGSGKSSTVVAKIGYALRTGFCQPEEILAVMFNRNAREELESRLAERLAGMGNRVATRTFHKLGKDIIADVEGKQPTPAPWEDSTQTSAAFIENLITELLNEPEFLSDWVLFRTVCFRPNRELALFKDQRDYDRYLQEVGQEREGRRGILTMNGELVRSMEELAIANWLFLNGVNYQYERSYEYETADRQHRQYYPDFFYPDINLYHEHFALDDQGKPPAIFKGDYEAGVHWKRALHAEKNTQLIETTSAMYRQGGLFTTLKAALENRGQIFRPRSSDEVLNQLNQKQTKYAPFLRTFITHLKSNGYSLEQLAIKVSSQRDQWRATVFLRIFTKVIERYQAALSDQGFIDYEDMVRRAADYVVEGKYRHPYRLILVDEFQDISQAGAALIRAMLEQSPACKLFAVGDDWQSINRFAGADIDIMANFAKRFGPTATNYLTRTFRSNQGISDVSAQLVQANPLQYRKTVQAISDRTQDVIQILEYERDEEADDLLARQLADIAAQGDSSKPTSVFILARYNHFKPANLHQLKSRFMGRLSIEFKSVHRSKGLEADYVFVLGMNCGAYAFPSSIEDDPLLEMVMPAKEEYPSAEERRLFYVALTRARHGVVLLTKRSRMSRFIPELLAPEFKGRVRYGAAQQAPAKTCPACKDGILREKFGKFGWFLGCSAFPECKHSENIGKTRLREAQVSHV